MRLTKPASVRLRPHELETLRDAAAFSDLSISDVIRRALVRYLGVEAPDIDRQDAAALVAEFGRLRADLARLGNLLKLALANGKRPLADTEREIQGALTDLKAALAAVIGSPPP